MSLVLATSLMTVSCATKEVVSPTAASPTTADLKGYSGEQLFRGIFLLEGAVAASLPSLQGPRMVIEKENTRNPVYIQVRASRNQQIVAAVRQLDAAYLGELKAAVESQQFEQIEASFRKGVLLLKAACVGNATNDAQLVRAREALKSIDLDKYNFSKEKDVDKFIAVMEAKKKELAAVTPATPASGGSGSASLYSQNMLVIEIAVALEAVAVVAVVFFWAKQPTQDSDALGHETLVKEIALNLSPANE